MKEVSHSKAADRSLRWLMFGIFVLVVVSGYSLYLVIDNYEAAMSLPPKTLGLGLALTLVLLDCFGVLLAIGATIGLLIKRLRKPSSSQSTPDKAYTR